MVVSFDPYLTQIGANRQGCSRGEPSAQVSGQHLQRGWTELAALSLASRLHGCSRRCVSQWWQPFVRCDDSLCRWGDSSPPWSAPKSREALQRRVSQDGLWMLEELARSSCFWTFSGSTSRTLDKSLRPGSLLHMRASPQTTRVTHIILYVLLACLVQ